jgi:hypothetical protein
METNDRLGNVNWRDFASIPEKIILIESLEMNIKRIKDGLDDYGDNEGTIKRWNRELIITKLEVLETLKIFK